MMETLNGKKITMKPCRYLLLLLVGSIGVRSPVQSQILYDTLSVRSVGPGMTHFHIVAPGVPWNIHVLQVDRLNPHMSFETVKANDRLAGFERVSSMARRKSAPGRIAVGAINGDFYGGTGIPTNIQIAQGEILVRPISRPAIGFDIRKAPMIDVVTMSVTATLGDTVAVVHGVNTTRSTDQLILFNSYAASTTGTNQFGTEALLRPLNPWIANDTVTCVVESVEVRIGNMTIPKGWAVLSAHGGSETGVMSRLHAGDSVKLFQRIAPGLPNLKEMIGGYPKLVAGGRDVSPDAPREPRTAAGFSADSTTLYLITVDGRQGNLSVGMTFAELAQFMIQSGVHEGINLDGGGSTTMVIRDSVMNSPSDGGERAVSNGLLVLSSAPTGSLSAVTISPKSARIFRRGQRQFLAFGRDEHGNPVEINPALIRFACDPQIGTIDSSTGVLATGSLQAAGFVYLRYGSYADSARVVVKTLGRIRLSPVDVVTDTTRTVSFSADSYDIDNLRQDLPLNAYEWTVTNPAVGFVNDVGVFKGLREGMTGVVASLDGLSDTALVRVEIGKGYATLDPLEDVAGWTATAVRVDSFSVTVVDSVSAAGTSSVRIDYSFTAAAEISYIYLDKSIPVYGVPDSVIIDARTDHHSHRIFYVIEDDNGEQFRLYSTRLLSRIGVLDTVRAPLSPNQVITPGARLNFPIVIKRIEVQLVFGRQAGAHYSGTLFLDNLRVSYPQKITTGVEWSPPPAPRDFELEQNYPNPFNATTHIRFSIPERAMTRLTVYDILGREVAFLVNELLEPGRYEARFEADHAASGMYIYVLTSGGHRLTNKMILLK